MAINMHDFVLANCRSERIFDIFTDVFGADARALRLKFVVGTWGFVCNNGAGCGVPATNATLSYGKVAAKADLVATAAYFDCGLGSNPVADALVSLYSSVGSSWVTIGLYKCLMEMTGLCHAYIMPEVHPHHGMH